MLPLFLNSHHIAPNKATLLISNNHTTATNASTTSTDDPWGAILPDSAVRCRFSPRTIAAGGETDEKKDRYIYFSSTLCSACAHNQVSSWRGGLPPRAGAETVAASLVVTVWAVDAEI
jgi:hypothetical protein